MSGALNCRSVGRWGVALAAAAFMVAGGYLGSAGFAQAAGESDINNIGSPGQDGKSITCYRYFDMATPGPPRDDAPDCDAVANGEDGESAVLNSR